MRCRHLDTETRYGGERTDGALESGGHRYLIAIPGRGES